MGEPERAEGDCECDRDDLQRGVPAADDGLGEEARRREDRDRRRALCGAQGRSASRTVTRLTS